MEFVFAFNTAVHKSTGFTPFYLLHGWNPHLITDIIEEQEDEDMNVVPAEVEVEDEDANISEIQQHVDQFRTAREK